tara:strand:+ start:257 stop:880 length:624 start_codon:yes stop_codon:yes gene_type:complete
MNKLNNNKVNVTADDMGNVINQSKNSPDYGYVRLEQNRVTLGNNGWVKNTKLTALLQGKVEDLQALELKSDSQLSGKILVKEQLEPFNTINSEADIKLAGKTGVICCIDGQPIYRKTFFVSDISAEDVLIAHDNSQDIKEANASASPKIDKYITPEEFNGTEEETTKKSFDNSTVDNIDDLEDSNEEIASVEESVEEVDMEMESFDL